MIDNFNCSFYKLLCCKRRTSTLAYLSQQRLDTPMEELTPDPDVSLQLLMDGVGRRKGKTAQERVGSSSRSRKVFFIQMSDYMKGVFQTTVVGDGASSHVPARIRSQRRSAPTRISCVPSRRSLGGSHALTRGGPSAYIAGIAQTMLASCICLLDPPSDLQPPSHQPPSSRSQFSILHTIV